MRDVMCCPLSPLYGTERKSDEKRINRHWQRDNENTCIIKNSSTKNKKNFAKINLNIRNLGVTVVWYQKDKNANNSKNGVSVQKSCH